MWNPRTCGEKSLTCERIDFRLGSPPRRRGKVQLVECILARAGITPAWAGKSPRRWGRCRAHRDHPRVGGEKTPCSRASTAPTGSPPRGRGKATFSGRSDPGVGITPAWAGKRNPPDIHASQTEDHPRVGGEKLDFRDGGSRRVGSPPRGRGKEGSCSSLAFAYRITPAWAGKRRLHHAADRTGGDHPRVGGEKTKKIP